VVGNSGLVNRGFPWGLGFGKFSQRGRRTRGKCSIRGKRVSKEKRDWGERSEKKRKGKKPIQSGLVTRLRGERKWEDVDAGKKKG